MRNLHTIGPRLTEDQIVQLWYCDQYHSSRHILTIKNNTPMCKAHLEWGIWTSYWDLNTARGMWIQEGKKRMPDISKVIYI